MQPALALLSAQQHSARFHLQQLERAHPHARPIQLTGALRLHVEHGERTFGRACVVDCSAQAQRRHQKEAGTIRYLNLLRSRRFRFGATRTSVARLLR